MCNDLEGEDNLSEVRKYIEFAHYIQVDSDDLDTAKRICGENALEVICTSDDAEDIEEAVAIAKFVGVSMAAIVQAKREGQENVLQNIKSADSERDLKQLEKAGIALELGDKVLSNAIKAAKKRIKAEKE